MKRRRGPSDDGRLVAEEQLDREPSSVPRLGTTQTPARDLWSNPRVRNADRHVHYDETSLGESGSEHSGSEGSSDPEDDDLHEDEEQPRYSRRVRATVQRYSPERPRAHGGRRSLRRHEDDSQSEYDGQGHVQQPGEHFSARYSVRERRTVERFNPVKFTRATTASMDGSGDLKRHSRHNTRSADLHGEEGGDGDGEGRENGTAGESDEDEDDDGDAEPKERRQYSFRDRALVTIKPAPAGQAQQDRWGSAPSTKRQRTDRFALRSGRAGRSRRFEDFDELPDVPAWGGAAAAGTAGTGGGQYGPGPGGFVPGITAGPAHAGGAAPQPWEVALGAAGQGGQAGGAAAAGGGTGGTAGGAAGLDITPVEVDPSMTFAQVGGLDHYVRALKEMVFLPLVYPELFERFHVSPPRGVLFYGPPGTGKTLVARALASHAARAAGGRRVSFFMRKGADVLSKWVGESERQLRLLFEEARRRQPSIIFFDELDGLAPVRSSKSDQIHNSIVSTLLALMDGLDPRGEVVVIGATNRVDGLDGALRRPGRFDRELVFPLPNQSARADILRIHTRSWADPPPAPLVEELSAASVGYCGADLKALCTEASLAALRRRYPQIYESEHKLQLDPAAVRVERRDFLTALQSITPASHRSAASPARPLPAPVAPVLLGHLQTALAQLQRAFPAAAAALQSGFGGGGAARPLLGARSLPSVQRPRLLVCGREGSGQVHLGSALLHALEGLPAHAIGLPSLLADPSARSPEEALVRAVAEARRAAPAVLYLPHLQAWWATAPGSLRATLWALLADLPPDLPLLLLATADEAAGDVDREALALFAGTQVVAGWGQGGGGMDGVYELALPTHSQRLQFFSAVATALVAPPPVEAAEGAAGAAQAALPALPLAADALAAEEEARAAAAEAAARTRYEEDQAALRALRMALRSQLHRLLQRRRWDYHWEPVPPEDDPEYYARVTHPMDLSTLLDRVDRRRYVTPAQFLADVALIPAAERQFWGDAPAGVRHISRSCALEDETRALVEGAVAPALTQRLEAMLAAGGPAPPPPGLHEAMGLAPDGTLPQPPRIEPAAAEVAATRRATRHAGGPAAVDDRIIHADPEAERRRIRAAAKQRQAAAAGAGAGQLGGQNLAVQQERPPPQQQQQQQHEDGEEVEEEEGAGAGTEAAAEEAGAEHDAAGAETGARGVLAATTRDNVPAGAIRTSDAVVVVSKVSKAGPERAELEEAAAVDGGGSEAVGSDEAEQEEDDVQLTPAQQAAVEELQQGLAQRTGGVVLDALEGLHARLARMAAERRAERNRRAVAEAALAAADEYVARLAQSQQQLV